MESIGEKFRQTRESKGYTIEQIARDTHIAKRFLESLEAENFDVFPGDPYLMGFMRTYAEYLGLDAQEIIQLYKNLKLQEQPAPIDELISRTPSRPIGRIIAIIVVVVAALGVGLYFLLSSGVLSRSPRPETTVEEETPPPGDILTLTDEIVEQRFTQGDRLLVPVGSDEFPIDLVGVADGLTLRTSAGEVTVGVGESRTLDLNGDERSDVLVILRSVDTIDSPPTVVMRVDRGAVRQTDATEAGTPAAGVADGQTTVAGTTGQTAAVGETSEPSRIQESTVIAEFDERDEFFVEVRFEGYALFRYQFDDEPRVEQYFQQGQTLRVSVRERFNLWVSNAGVARLRVAGQDLTLGDIGEVTAALVTWATPPSAQTQRLELIPVY
jgi:cytoskeletal protein RodZ